ncbi:MAG TPA: hypothetical protein DEP65_13645 [Ruminococcus sp.]|nr:hypothetical protein [Ruminococcus sp.]
MNVSEREIKKGARRYEKTMRKLKKQGYTTPQYERELELDRRMKAHDKFLRKMNRDLKIKKGKVNFLAGMDFYKERLASTTRSVLYSILNVISRIAILLTVICGIVVICNIVGNGFSLDILKSNSFLLFAVSGISGIICTVLMAFFC